MIDAQGYTIRPVEKADLRKIATLLNRSYAKLLDGPYALIDGQGDLHQIRYIPDSAMQVVAVANDGSIVGYQFLKRSEPYVVFEFPGTLLRSMGWRPGSRQLSVQREGH